MRDLDAVQEHEVRQQELVQKIAISLHQATGENENYVDQFHGWAENILSTLRGTYTANPDEQEFEQLVMTPIKRFASDVREQHYLLMKLLQEKILTSISSRINGEYEAAQFELELAADRARA